jgi:hypothetical protein
MLLSARCIAARRLAFSLARDSAQARNSEIVGGGQFDGVPLHSDHLAQRDRI